MTAPAVLALFGDMSGCTLWRLFWPYKELRRLGWFAFPCLKDGQGAYDPVPAYWQANSVVMARLSWDDAATGEGFRAMCHRDGKALLYEVDDDLFTEASLERSALFSAAEAAVFEQQRQGRIRALQLCDGVTVTAPRLATLVRQFTEAPVEVVPNLLDWHWFTREVQRAPRTTPSPCIGWAGGKRPDRDLDVMAVAWKRIARRFPAVHFYVQGWEAPVLRDAVPPDRLTLAPWLPLEEYPRGLKNVDIGCCPLADEPFNHCKTPIKAWEYAAAGAVTVASPTVYGTLGAEGRAFLLASTADEWEDALATLVQDEPLRAELARALRWRVEKLHSLHSRWHRGQPAVMRWVGAWQRILEAYQATQRRARLWLPNGVAG